MLKARFRSIAFALRVPFLFLAILWGVQVVQYLSGINLGYLGIYPRDSSGLWGILLAPMIHGGFGHLISNSIPLLMLSILILLFYRRIALPSMLLIYVLTGVLVWVFGRPVYHIGASGVVYGLVAFVFWNGVFRRNVKSIALAGVVLFYYGSMFAGILPGQEGISWESHLLGAGAGIFVSFAYKKRMERDEVRLEPPPEEAPRYFLDRDIFNQRRG